MERLTMKNSDGTYSQPTHLTFEKMFYKLAEIEDFMEDMGFECLEDIYKDMVKFKKNINVIYQLKQEKQALKDNWEKLKEWIHNRDENCGSLEIHFVYKDMLSEMQELENGGNNEKNN